MTPDLVAHLASRWNGDAGEMPILEHEIACPASSDLLGDIARMVVAAEQDLRALILASLRTEVPPATADELLPRFSWLVSTLRGWDAADDPVGRRLYGALAAAAIWGAGGNLWNVLTPLLPNVNDLAAALERILGSRQFRPQIPGNTPLRERELLDKMLDADRREDWAALAEVSHAFPLTICDVGFVQAAQALWVIDPLRLAVFAAGRPTWLETAILLTALTVTAACHVAAESGSARVRFAVLEYLANRHQTNLSSDENGALRELFVAAAADQAAWTAFMRAFNRYPVRHQSMQLSLGQALARASTAAIQAYVDAIDLNNGHVSSQTVTYCLSEFRSHAPTELRMVLWSRAYERWDTWNFGEADGQYLIAPARSVLDFAVMGWLLECAPGDFVQGQIAAFDAQLQEIDAKWHASVTMFRSAVNRLRSRFLLFCHAMTMDAGNLDWLADASQDLPNALTNAYVKARYANYWD